MDMYDELRAVIDSFDQGGIEYAVCGGIAVAFHGYARFTKDIDILVRADELESAFEIAEQAGFVFQTSPMRFKAGTPEECVVHRRSKIEGAEQLILDIMPVTQVLDDVWKSRIVFDWKDRRIKVVSMNGLASMKRLSGRERDLLDLKELGLENDREENDRAVDDNATSQDEDG